MRTNIKSFEEKDNEDKELLISVLREQLKVCDDKIETLLEEDSCVFLEKELEEEMDYIEEERLGIYEKIGKMMEIE